MSSDINTSLRTEYNGVKQHHTQEQDCFVPRNDGRKNLLLVFVKNPILGKVKTRLAKVIGNEKALAVYEKLLNITFNEVAKLAIEQRIYFSLKIDEKWQKKNNFIQKGADLGEKMQNAIEKGFEDGFNKIILIGSDLPDISTKIIEEGFDKLTKHEVVFGPAQDGGYYLVGMTKKHFCIFQNKQWSTENLLKTTLNELNKKQISYSLLDILNDIDTIEDLEKSSIYRYLSLKP